MSADGRLFLRAIELDNFRSFGADKSIPLHPGPSVLVVAGTNGLGKTTLIEGIEWALTGGIRRFKSQHSDKDVDAALTRRAQGVAPGSHGVTLRFDGDTTIARGPHARPTAEEVAAVLRHPTWADPIGDLSTYLGLTHFLSQSPTLRLTFRSPEERWKDLKDLAGAGGVDRMLDRLGQGTKSQLQSGVTRANADLKALRGTRDSLTDLLDEVRKLEALLGAGDARSADAVLAEGEMLARRLQAAAGVAVELPDDATEVLTVLGAAGNRARAATTAMQAALARAEALPEAWRKLASDLAALRPHAAMIRLAHVTARRDHLARVPALNAALDTALERLQECRRTADAAKTAQVEPEALHTRMAELDEALRSEKQVLKGWQELAAAEAAARDAARAVADEAAARQEAQDALRQEEERAQALQQAHADAELELVAAEADRVKASKSVEEKAGHLSALIRELHADDVECPLCLATHDHGDLLERAGRALARQDPHLTAVTERVAAIRGRIKACLEDIAGHAPVLTAAKERLAPFEKRKEDAAEAADALLGDGRVAGRPLDGLAPWLAERLAAAEAAVERCRTAMRDLDPDDSLQDRRTRAAAAVQRAGEAVQAAEAEVRRRRGERDVVLQGAGAPKVEPDAVPAELNAAEVAVATAALDKETAVSNLAPGPDTASDDQSSVKAKLEALEQQINDLEDKQAATLALWREAGLDGEPSAATRMTAQERAAAAEAEIHAIETRRSDLHRGYERWLADARRRDVQARIAGILTEQTADGVDACLASLEERITQAQTRAASWARARRLADAVETAVKAEKDDFYGAIVQPLAARANAFDRAWSSFPEYLIDYVPHRIRGHTEMKMLLDGAAADLRLSEGQAGVKALSFLLAASTSHRWSRWRALLLDDPLQFNDLVHKSAFLDVLRPLVLEDRYQVILSTHDIEEARFIERKCASAGIAFTLCRLHAIGEAGVVYTLE